VKKLEKSVFKISNMLSSTLILCIEAHHINAQCYNPDEYQLNLYRLKNLKSLNLDVHSLHTEVCFNKALNQRKNNSLKYQKITIFG
jgi:hypothetical protein